MRLAAERQLVTPPDDHILTAQEALEPLYAKLEEEAEVQLIAAAVRAGWSPEEAAAAIDQLRRSEFVPKSPPRH